MNFAKAAKSSMAAIGVGILGDVIFGVAYFIFAAVFAAAALFDPLNQAEKVETLFGGFLPQIVLHLFLTILTGFVIGIFAALVAENKKNIYLLTVGFALSVNLILWLIAGFAFILITKNEVFKIDLIFFSLWLFVVAPLKGLMAAFAAKR